jgi:hypothetical protein
LLDQEADVFGTEHSATNIGCVQSGWRIFGNRTDQEVLHPVTMEVGLPRGMWRRPPAWQEARRRRDYHAPLLAAEQVPGGRAVLIPDVRNQSSVCGMSVAEYRKESIWTLPSSATTPIIRPVNPPATSVER